jgi:antitoxin FitA
VLSLIAMAQLIVRNLPQAIVDALKRRAARHGRSAEAEHRILLEAALLQKHKGTLKAHLLSMPEGGDDSDFDIPREAGRRVAL